MVEHEPRLGVALLQGGGGLPAHVTENVAGARRLDDRDVDVDGLDAEASHMRQQGRAGVEHHATLDDDGAVITLWGERGPRAEKCEFQATVTAGLRYTSWIAFNSSIPSFIGRWNDFRPEINPIPPARLLMTEVRTASTRSAAPCDSPPELIKPDRPMKQLTT